jgi:hypothetical protein
VRCLSTAREVMMVATRVSADDFFTGLLAGIAYRGRRRISIRGERFDRVIASLVEELVKRHGDEVDLRFRVRPHYIHGESTTVRDAIAAATQADLISLDNPEYQDIRLKIARTTAEEILEDLPLEKDVLLELTDWFLTAYDREVASEPVPA